MTTKSNPPAIAQNMTQAETLFGIPKAIQRASKRAGCEAFRAQRIHREPLLAWVEANPQIVAEIEAATAKSSDLAEIRLAKLRAEIRLLTSKDERLQAECIPTKAAESEWRRACRIIFAELVARIGPDQSEAIRKASNAKLPPSLTVVPLTTV